MPEASRLVLHIDELKVPATEGRQSLAGEVSPINALGDMPRPAGDKHHIYEFGAGGGNTAANLIVLCPTCHRQIPSLLSKEQQRFLQCWHEESMVSQHVTHRFDSRLDQFFLGNNLYKDTESYITVNDGKIIYLYEQNGRHYINAVMLDNFTPRLLLLSNRLIFGDGDATLVVDTKSLRVDVWGSRMLELSHTAEGIAKLVMHFWYKDLECDINDDRTLLFGEWWSMTNCTFTRSKIAWTG